MKPVPFDPGWRYPALLWIHGGPHREFSELYWHEAQVETAAGYAIIYINPRGSQGYGEAFSRASVGDWGGEDFAALMAASTKRSVASHSSTAVASACSV